MANRSDRDDLQAPPIFRTFAGGVLRALESTDAPAQAQHLPCQLTVHVVAGPKNLVMKDALGVSSTLPFPTGVFTFRCAPLTIEAATTAEFVTVYWQRAVRVG